MSKFCVHACVHIGNNYISKKRYKQVYSLPHTAQEKYRGKIRIWKKWRCKM